ncbi:MAG: PKD domain-containing protein [Bacteroidales bacterium]
MRTSIISSVIFAGVFLLISTFLYGQSQPNERKWSLGNPPPMNEKHVVDQSSASNRPGHLSNDFFKAGKASTLSKDEIDTLNFPLPGNYLFYLSNDGGYVAGNNFFGDLAKVNYFENELPGQLTGILFEFAYAKGGAAEIEFAVWDNTGQDDSPGNIMSSHTIPLDVIIDQVNNQQITYVEFDQPIDLGTSFYAGVILPQNTGDTLALWTNTDGDLVPGIAWEQWSDGDWYPMNSMATWGLELSLAVFPIINRGDLPLLANFVSDVNQLQPGGMVQFSDVSTGNPISWEWEFEGGLPFTSSDQNPMVTYNQIGSYNVTLTVANDSATNTKTLEDFITVTESTVFIDTLNYPLAGTWSVYVTDENGFVTGNNEYGDLAKANFYNHEQSGYITGVLLEFVYAAGGNPDIEIALWDDSGTGASPGSKMGSATTSWNTITNDIVEGQMTYVPFDPPIMVNASFYAGFELPTTVGDTLVVWSNMDGDTNPGIAWEQWDDGTWNPFSWAWELDIAMAIFPIYQNTLSVDEVETNKQLRVFPNPSNGVISLVIDSQLRMPIIIQVLNMNGTLVMESIINTWISDFRLDLSSQPNGIYMLKTISEAVVLTQKILKQ